MTPIIEPVIILVTLFSYSMYTYIFPDIILNNGAKSQIKWPCKNWLDSMLILLNL